MTKQWVWQWLGRLLLLTSLVGGWGEQLGLASPVTHQSDPSALPQQQTLADQQMRVAQTFVRYLPNEIEGYNQLASAYLLKSRETGDFSYVTKAESALARSQQLVPDNEAALKLQLTLLLTEHRFQEGLDRARQLQSRFPQDPQVETSLIDALVEVGDYAAANLTARNLMKLRPNAAVYARLSYLRSLQGDQAGAIAAMQQAVQTANPHDLEGLAWYHVHLGIELLNSGQWEAGEQAIDQALQVFPEYPLALSAKARARLTAKDWEQAVVFYQRSQSQMPLPDTAIALGDLYQRLGKVTLAQRQYDLVNFLVQAGGDPFRKAYAHQLVLFWADQGTHLDQALTLIQQERLTRSDVYTFDALAWCLFKLDRPLEAQEAIQQALRLGTPDARIYYHAGQIAYSSGKFAQAAQFFQQALRLNPVFHPLQADLARQTLAICHSKIDG